MTAPALPPLILGANVFGWSLDAAASERLLDAALERGLTAIDTADVYSYWGAGNSGGEFGNHHRQLDAQARQP